MANGAKIRTEAQAEFFDTLLSIELATKVCTGALREVGSCVERDGPMHYGRVIDLAGEPWTRSVRLPKNTADTSLGHVLRSFTTILFSALDRFCTREAKDRERYFGVTLPETPPKEKNPFRRLLLNLGLSTVPVNSLLPLLDFYRLLRNRVAHQNAVAGSRLVRARSEPAVGAGLATLRSHFDAAPGRTARTPRATPQWIPDLPAVSKGARLDLRPRDVVLIAILLRTMGLLTLPSLNRGLGTDGFVLLALNHALLDERGHQHRRPLPKRRDDAEAALTAINHFVLHRYGVHVASNSLRQRLVDLGRWEDALQAVRRLRAQGACAS